MHKARLLWSSVSDQRRNTRVKQWTLPLPIGLKQNGTSPGYPHSGRGAISFHGWVAPSTAPGQLLVATRQTVMSAPADTTGRLRGRSPRAARKDDAVQKMSMQPRNASTMPSGTVFEKEGGELSNPPQMCQGHTELPTEDVRDVILQYGGAATSRYGCRSTSTRSLSASIAEECLRARQLWRDDSKAQDETGGAGSTSLGPHELQVQHVPHEG